MQINSVLLYFFAQNIKFSPDVASSLRRFQILAIIYTYLASICKVGLFETSLWMILPNADPPSLVFFVCFCSFFGLLFLKSGYHNASVAVLLGYLHLGSLAVSCSGDHPVAAFYCLYPIIMAGFFLTSSLKLKLLNILCCFFQVANNVWRISNKYELALSPEQYQNFSTSVVSSVTSLLLTAFACSIQNSVQESLIKVAECNYLKSENLNKELVSSHQHQEQFLSSLCHEITNPLNTMTSSMDHRLETIKDGANLASLRSMKLSSEILLNLLNDFMSVVKLKSNKIVLQPHEASIEGIIKKVFQINSESFKAAKIKARAYIDQNVPENLWLDSSKVLQVMMNLVSNCLLHTPSGGEISVQVTWHPSENNLDAILQPSLTSKFNSWSQWRSFDDLRSVASFEKASPSKDLNEASGLDEFTTDEEESRRKNFNSLNHSRSKSFGQPNKTLTQRLGTEENKEEGWNICRIQLDGNPSSSQSNKGYLKIEVIDSGCGISDKDMPKLFKLFSQGELHMNTIQKGFGLGLWVCKQICHALNGDITVLSKSGKGTNFIFGIPICNENIAQKVIPKKITKRSGPVRALVVDDYSYNRELHKLLLESEGVQVTVANDGKECLEKYLNQGQNHFDFILTDVQMPEMDGFTSAKKIREWETNQNKDNVDIYFLSGDYFNEDDVMTEFKIKNSGKDPKVWCMKKPIDVQSLKRIVKKYK